MTDTTSRGAATRLTSLFGVLFICLPLLSVGLSVLAWLTYGIDIPYMDDWRPYILNEAGTFAPEVLFRPINDTMSPVGLALDSASLRWLGGSSIAYQTVSMSVVLLSLLGLQWLLLRHVLRRKALTACAFCFTLLMLQPGSYWGEQNLAFHQAIPLVCILAALYLVVASNLSRAYLAASLVALGLVSGFTYISGAFGYFACGVVLAICALGRSGAARSRMMLGGAVIALTGLAASIPQAWGLLFYQKGTHRADAPMAFPHEGDFWFYLLGKIGRSLLLPTSHAALSLALTALAVMLVLCLLYVAFRQGRREPPPGNEGAPTNIADGFAITLALSAVVFTYLLMVAAGRANLRDVSMTDGLQIFVFGYLRFHFFWATLVWPWAVALALAWRASRSPDLRLAWPYAATAACAVLFVSAGALNHFKAFRDVSVARSVGVDCLRKASEAMEPMLCMSIEARDLRPALQVAERHGATFTRYIRSSAVGATPAGRDNTGIILIGPGTFVDGQFTADRPGKISSIAIPIGNFGGLSDGQLEISVCDARRCATARSDLVDSSDNSYVEVRFDGMVSAEPDGRVPFRIRTLSATHPVAVWTTPKIEGSAQILRVHEAGGTDKTVPGQTIRIEAGYIR